MQNQVTRELYVRTLALVGKLQGNLEGSKG